MRHQMPAARRTVSRNVVEGLRRTLELPCLTFDMTSKVPGRWGVLAVLCVLMGLGAFGPVLRPDTPGQAGVALAFNLLVAWPSFSALGRRLGASAAAWVLLQLALFGWLIESVGVLTGFPYGGFHYSPKLEPLLFGVVPLGLPLSWPPLVLAAVAATEGRRGWTVRATALLVAFDLVLDPGAAAVGFWVWHTPRGFYGVPWTNFAGWCLSGAVGCALVVRALRRATLEGTHGRGVEPAMLDTALAGLAFWSVVAALVGLHAPLALGILLFAGLLRRRARMVRDLRREPSIGVGVRPILLLTLATMLGCARSGAEHSPEKTPNPPVQPMSTSSFHSLHAKSLDGKDVDLSQYAGKVVLVVNTASECGYTPQYAGLEKLHEEYAAKGLAVLGFPCNDFGGQEPGSAADIATFCKKNYGVSFPMFEKVAITDASARHPVYQFLTKDAPPPQWNFHKFLVDKKGQVVGSFPSKVAPDSATLRAAIDKALAS